MTRHFTLAIVVPLLVVLLWLVGPGFSRTLTPSRFSAHLLAQAPPVEPGTLIDNLSALDFYTRNNAARLVRRAPAPEAVAALTEAVRRHADEFVRYRALVLLTAFNDRGTRDLMVGLLRDRNDRLREVAYRWLERNPDPRLTETLMAGLQTEQAEFVRPALVSALAALDGNAEVRRALLAESMRGLDFFREAVIEALGRRRAEYAVDTIAGISKIDGPLRESAILALGRIGGPRARVVLEVIAPEAGDAGPMVRAAQCLAGVACAAHITALGDAAGGAGNAASVRAAVAALAAIATGSGSVPGPTASDRASGSAANDVVSGFNLAAAELLVSFAARDGLAREQAALGFSTVALRRPEAVVAWLDTAPGSVRTPAIDLLREGFERLEEDFAEEQFYAAARAAYWRAAEGSATRALSADLIQTLDF